MTTPITVLKKKATLTTKPGDLPLRAWIDFARKTINEAEGNERVGNDEGAYVEWRKWAQVMDTVLKHPEYKASMRAKSPDYLAYQDIKQRFPSSASRMQALEAKLTKRDLTSSVSPASLVTTNGASHDTVPASFAPSAVPVATPPTSPPPPSSVPMSPDATKKGRPVSGNLASRMAALESAGLDIHSPRSTHLPSHAEEAPPPPPTTSADGSPLIPPLASQSNSPSMSNKPRRPLPPTPAGFSAVPPPPPPPSDAVARLHAAEMVRPASAPIEPVTESLMASPPVPARVDGMISPPPAPQIAIQPTGLGFAANQFPSLGDFDHRFTSTFDAESSSSRRPSAASLPVGKTDSTHSLQRSPRMDLAASPPETRRALAAESTGRALINEAGHRMSSDVPRSLPARTLPRTNYILPDSLHKYLQASPEDQPTLLLLDVRNRDDFDRGHIEAPYCICIEPITLSHEVPSDRLEASLVISPPAERSAFMSRDKFDLIVIYDRSSTTIPVHSPGPQSKEPARYLYNLHSAIFEREYHRSLRRPPVILVGGYEAWLQYLQTKQSFGPHPPPPPGPPTGVAEASARLEAGRERSESVSNTDLKRSHRKASINNSEIPQYNQPSVSRSMVDAITNNAYSGGSANNGGNPTGHLTRSSSGFSGISPIASPPLAAVPSIARQHSDSTASFVYPSGFSPPPRQRTTIDYPQLSSLPQRPPMAVQSNGAPPRPAIMKPQVQRLSSASYSTDFKGPDSPYTPALSYEIFANLLNWGDGTVGMTGLKNLGNTCYMNSTLQCLSATIPLARFFKDGSYKKAINRSNQFGTRGALAEAVAQLFGVLWSEQYNFVSPVTFRDAICRFAPQFQGTDQHDSQEFLAFLLDGLHEDLNLVKQKPQPMTYTAEREAELEMLPPQIGGEKEWNIYLQRENSPIVAWFQGQYRSKLTCQTCGKTSTTYNNFMYLTLALPSSRFIGNSRVALESLLSAFVQEEVLDKDDAWNCPRCKTARKATKRLTIVRLPPVLIIHLKRFQFRGPFSDKIDTPVMFPLHGLDMSPYMPPALPTNVIAQYEKVVSVPKVHTSTIYDLYAVSEQMGTLSSGHYTAKARSRDNWSEIGDSKVRKCSEDEVRRSVKTAYILFYRRR